MAELIDFCIAVLRYVAGVAIIALSTTSIKLFIDVLRLKKDVSTLQEQRKSDLIEYNTAITMANSIKSEASNLEHKFDSKLKDVLHELSEQRHQDNAMMQGVVSEIKTTLAELNTTIKFLKPETK